MDRQRAQAQLAQLKQQLNQERHAYYTQDAPLVTDAEYDRKYQQLLRLEQQFPELVTPDSPSQLVGDSPSPDFTKVRHEVPMLSMGDVFSYQELQEFNTRIHKTLEQAVDYCVELKIDGLALSLIYRQGRSGVNAWRRKCGRRCNRQCADYCQHSHHFAGTCRFGSARGMLHA